VVLALCVDVRVPVMLGVSVADGVSVIEEVSVSDADSVALDVCVTLELCVRLRDPELLGVGDGLREALALEVPLGLGVPEMLCVPVMDGDPDGEGVAVLEADCVPVSERVTACVGVCESVPEDPCEGV
jgi:hypothetical protein